VLLHSCNGNWLRLDERWGKRIASWGYVTLSVDSFGPRGLKSTCDSNAPIDLGLDAYRALNYLARQPFVDPARVAALGFSQGGWLAFVSVERGIIEQTSQTKFRSAIAFYPPCRAFRGDMTVPTLVLVGELDDWTPADECRSMVDGRDDWAPRGRGARGSRRSSSSIPAPITLSMRRASRRRSNCSGITSNSTGRQTIKRSTRFVNFWTRRSAQKRSPGERACPGDFLRSARERALDSGNRCHRRNRRYLCRHSPDAGAPAWSI